MKPSRKICCIFSSIAAMIVVSMLLFNVNVKEKAWQNGGPELPGGNPASIKEDAQLESEIKRLGEKNNRLKPSVASYKIKVEQLQHDAADCCQNERLYTNGLPESLAKEEPEIRAMYLRLLTEKRRWDRYQRRHYNEVLESWFEPEAIESSRLVLVDEDNREYFVELEEALKIHRVLVRDVRSFHDEVQFQLAQFEAQQPYSFYDLKLELGPFARESGLADAIQQAMSALSVGIYQQEALEVLDRLGEAFTTPARQFYEPRQDSGAPSTPTPYNYNIYIVFGKKIIDYSDRLSRQPFIPLDATARGELDYFSRMLLQSLNDLHRAGQQAAIDSAHLDLEELERVINSTY